MVIFLQWKYWRKGILVEHMTIACTVLVGIHAQIFALLTMWYFNILWLLVWENHHVEYLIGRSSTHGQFSIGMSNYRRVFSFSMGVCSFFNCSWLFRLRLEEKLNCTSFDSVRSACCDAQHVDEQGNQLLCDREAARGNQLDVGRLLF